MRRSIGLRAEAAITMSCCCAASPDTVYASFGVPVQVLANGVPVNGLTSPTGATAHFSLAAPAGATNLRFAMSGGSGDADLYVRRATQPDASTFDCRPFLVGTTEECVIPAPATGPWYVMLRGDPSFGGVSLRASYVAPGTGAAGLFCDGIGGTGGDVRALDPCGCPGDATRARRGAWIPSPRFYRLACSRISCPTSVQLPVSRW